MNLFGLDAYDRKARLSPATLAVLPLLVLAAGLLVSPQRWPGLVPLTTACGLAYLVIQIVRDLGFNLEKRLWTGWGGAPTTRMLRWAEAPNKVLQRDRHASVARATGMSLPDERREQADPTRADDVYEAAVAKLRNLTSARQDTLVTTELANYGFRRNLLGCRPIGVGLAVLAAITSAVLIALDQRGTLQLPIAPLITATAVSLLWALGWLVLVTPDFVHTAARKYATALLDAASRLAPPVS